MRNPDKLNLPTLEECSEELQKKVKSHRRRFSRMTSTERAESEKDIYSLYRSEVKGTSYASGYDAVSGLVGQDISTNHHVWYRKYLLTHSQHSARIWAITDKGRIVDAYKVNNWINLLMDAGMEPATAIDLVVDTWESCKYLEKDIKEKIDEVLLSLVRERVAPKVKRPKKSPEQNRKVSETRRAVGEIRKVVADWMESQVEGLPHDDGYQLVEEFMGYFKNDILDSFRNRVRRARERPQGTLAPSDHLSEVVDAFKTLEMDPPPSGTELDTRKIKAKYRMLMFQAHPDRNKDDPESALKRTVSIGNAWNVIQELEKMNKGTML